VSRARAARTTVLSGRSGAQRAPRQRSTPEGPRRGEGSAAPSWRIGCDPTSRRGRPNPPRTHLQATEQERLTNELACAVPSSDCVSSLRYLRQPRPDGRTPVPDPLRNSHDALIAACFEAKWVCLTIQHFERFSLLSFGVPASVCASMPATYEVASCRTRLLPNEAASGVENISRTCLKLASPEP
jgi:hypothetical protein